MHACILCTGKSQGRVRESQGISGMKFKLNVYLLYSYNIFIDGRFMVGELLKVKNTLYYYINIYI